MAGIYIHIPFCKQQCNYCDFHFSTSLKNKSDLISSLVAEMKLQRNFFNGTKITTIYIGGGTPSILSENDFAKLFEELNSSFDINNVKEVTIEANPDDLTSKKIQTLRKTPINRFSVGVQSFFDSDLQFMNRAHNSQLAYNSILKLQDAGWNNITVDLIYGTPTLSQKNWQKNLEKVIELNVPHLSAYGLSVEEKTPLFYAIKTGKQKALDEVKSKIQFEFLMDFMPKNGLHQYEISNFSKPGFEAIHNGSYWSDEIYLGIGPSAHSFDGKKRFWNVSNNISYIKSIQNNNLNRESETINEVQRFNEYVMTSLRVRSGCSENYIKSRFSSVFVDFLALSTKKWIISEHILKKDGFLKLTKKGKLMADYISSDLFYVP